MSKWLGLACLGLLLVVVAGTFDAEALYVPGVAFAVLAPASAAWVALAARGVRVTRTLAARRIVEEEPLEVRVRAGVGKLPLPGGMLEDELLGEGVELPLGMRGSRVRIHARFVRRGRRALRAPEVLVRDPLGLAERVVRGPEDQEVLVLPRIEPIRRAPGAGGDGTVRRGGRPAIAAEVELDGVREHQPGSPASRIYWPALARGSGLMERRLRSETDATPLVVLDTRGAGGEEHRDALDAAVRAAASLTVALARQGAVGVLLPGDRRPTVLDASLGGWPHLHARLALVEAAAPPNLAALAARVGPVLYVAARPPSRTPRALAHAPASGRTLVVPGTLPGRRPVFSVAGCTGYDASPARVRRGAAA
jgi:uncharacterized protein (DUF58 family)